MTEFLANLPLAPVPDDLTIPQFVFDHKHPLRPARGDVPFFINDATGHKVSEKEAFRRTHALANGLSRRWDVGDKDVVCIYSPNHIDYPILIWAVHRLGGVITGSNPAYTVEELIHQLKLTQTTIVFTLPPLLGIVTAACKAVGIPLERIVLLDSVSGTSHVSVDQLVEDGLKNKLNFTEKKLAPGEAKTKVAFFSLSSGTTGPPKAVAVSHFNVVSNVLQMTTHNLGAELAAGVPPEKRRFRVGDVLTGVLPFFHIYGLVMGIHQMIFTGTTVVIMPKFAWPDFLESVVRHRITSLVVVPPMIVLLTKHPLVKKYDLSHVHFCYSGAAPLSGPLIAELAKVIPNADIGQGYGMTETATAVTLTEPLLKVGSSGSAGILLPGVKMRIVKADGSLARNNEPGELFVHSPSNALRYHQNPKATAETFIDGWVRTGDEAIITDNGELFIVDRLKELIKVRGFQVAPAELEGHLLEHADVADACVVGVPDDFSGEIPFAFVTLRAPAATRAASSVNEANAIRADIYKHVADVKTKYKWLDGGIEFIDVIPKNPSGKLLRRLLRDKAKEIRAAVVAKAEAKAKL
ncbi:phenylacetyl-CoA ligase [Auriscalpium vulgare]|uniref:Phenylacetyl-CoA ligase n=1 Tax=Auriscalpium vulgare TaxID=40419 RepID=A0ACB8RS31_9AGAM|nr:phenylacetyl-CoA ligase [Auriscalpium vulgare]